MADSDDAGALEPEPATDQDAPIADPGDQAAAGGPAATAPAVPPGGEAPVAPGPPPATPTPAAPRTAGLRATTTGEHTDPRHRRKPTRHQ